jgi:hypothetical protein
LKKNPPKYCASHLPNPYTVLLTPNVWFLHFLGPDQFGGKEGGLRIYFEIYNKIFKTSIKIKTYSG